ncbi:hypothetical protein MGN70_001752 [Eutypa lata]|nr:hypothetical protein MGN70_001752 [Eutypa lata]
MTEEDRDAVYQQLVEDALLKKLPLPKQITSQKAKATAKVRAKAKAKVRAKVRAKIKAKATAKAKAKATAKAKLAPSGCTLPLSKLSRPQNWRRCRRRQLLRPRQSTRSSRRGRGTRSKVADQSLYLECENTGGRHSQFAICLGRVSSKKKTTTAKKPPVKKDTSNNPIPCNECEERFKTPVTLAYIRGDSILDSNVSSLPARATTAPPTSLIPRGCSSFTRAACTAANKSTPTRRAESTLACGADRQVSQNL